MERAASTPSTHPKHRTAEQCSAANHAPVTAKSLYASTRCEQPAVQSAASTRSMSAGISSHFATVCCMPCTPLSTLHRVAPVAWHPFHFFAIVLQLCGAALRLSLCPSETHCSCIPSPCVPCLHADAIPSHAPPLNPGASDVLTCPPTHLPYYVCRPRPRMHCLNTPILFLQFTRIAPYPCMRNCPSVFPVCCADPSLLHSS